MTSWSGPRHARPRPEPWSATSAGSLLERVDIDILSHVVSIGDIQAKTQLPTPDDRPAIEADPVRCLDPEASAAMIAAIDRAREGKDTLGGVFEVVAHGLPVGIGSHVHYDRKLDALLAGAVMSIPAVKGVEVGDGFACRSLTGLAGPRRDRAHRWPGLPRHQSRRRHRGRDEQR